MNWGKFEVPITLSLFGVLKLFHLLLLICGLTVVHILFLDLDKTFLTCFLLDHINTISVYFSIVKPCLIMIKMNLKIEKTFNAISIECWFITWKIQGLTLLYFKNIWRNNVSLYKCKFVIIPITNMNLNNKWLVLMPGNLHAFDILRRIKQVYYWSKSTSYLTVSFFTSK